MSMGEVALHAYLAGLIDGEGWIGVSRRLPTPANRMRSPKYSPRVSVSMTDMPPLDRLLSFFDHPIRVVTRIRKAGYKPIHEVSIENLDAERLLLAVRPYLAGKAKQADKVLELARLRRESKQHRTKVMHEGVFSSGRAAGHAYVVRGLSDEFIARCDFIYQSLLRGSPRSGNGFRFQGGAA